MRKSKQTAEEIFEAEKFAENRRAKRNKAFNAMHDRDRGWKRLSNGVLFEWPAPGEWSAEVNGISTLSGNNIPEGYFVLTVGKEKRLFDTEEFRQWLRWC